MMDLRAIASVLGGNVTAGGVLFPGPGHSPRDRSASLRFDPGAADGFVVHSFAGDDPLPIRDHVRDVLQGAHHASPSAHRPVSPVDDAERTARAITLWNEARHPLDTPVQAYFARRGLALPATAAGEAIRYHPVCPFAGRHVPAMVALVRDVVTDAPKGLHRTALSADGHKVEVDGKGRMALGPIAGGAVKLTPDADVTLALGIGEGVETTLSLTLVAEFGSSPIWAVISAAGVEHFPVLSGIETLWLAVDHDPAGIKAARVCSNRWQQAGRETFRVKPTASRADLNDLVLGEARRGRSA